MIIENGEEKRPVARRVTVRGVVQGVGFRPHVFRLAEAHRLVGWVRNDPEGVTVHLEGPEAAVDACIRALIERPPKAARIRDWRVEEDALEFSARFEILESAAGRRPTAEIPADLATCEECLSELFDPNDRRYLYPYINCTNCGPRYTVITALPYDRPNTTMAAWTMCPRCRAEYEEPLDRRFHAQPTACPECGPNVWLLDVDGRKRDGEAAIRMAARRLREGKIVAVKGLGGYLLACDAERPEAVFTLRERKARGDKPFALMVRSVEVARDLVRLDPDGEALLTAPERPIVLARAKRELPGVAPGNGDLGVMLPYTPLHHLLFHFGAPPVLVMTSGNRSGIPMVYRDEDALEVLGSVADALLIGERPIARRVDDSVVRLTAAGPVMIRRARGYAPRFVARLPAEGPVLALGGDLKSAVTLVVDGRALLSEHLGDLETYEAQVAFEAAVEALLSMYGVSKTELIVAFDRHPDYRSAQFAETLPTRRRVPVQHHRAHIASVLAEREAPEARVVGVAFDGTGYGDDGAIWGGEFFVGSLTAGFRRAGHLRYARLPGGDAAARFPLQALAGFVVEAPDVVQRLARRRALPTRFWQALKLAEGNVQTVPTTSAGRLFDAVAALLGFDRAITFEGQAAIWLEHLAARAQSGERRSSERYPFEPRYPFPWRDGELDYRPLLAAMVDDLVSGRPAAEIALAFHRSVAGTIAETAAELFRREKAEAVVVAGGVFQNAVLLEALKAALEAHGVPLWVPRAVPPNDGGLSLGQAALAVTGGGAGRHEEP